MEAVAIGCESAWVKTAQMGRGPPYTRVMEKKIDQEEWYNARRSTDPESLQAQDRNNHLNARTERVHYALGLICVQQDLANFGLEGDGKDHNGMTCTAPNFNPANANHGKTAS